MSLLGLIVLIVAAGVILWAVHKWAPMDARILQILDIVVIVVVALVVLSAFGVLDALRGVQVPRMR